MPPACSCVSSRCSASIRFSIGGCVENSVFTVLFTVVGTMKKAFIPWASRRSWFGTCCIAPEIFTSAEASALGRPVTIAAPRSAPYSR